MTYIYKLKYQGYSYVRFQKIFTLRLQEYFLLSRLKNNGLNLKLIVNIVLSIVMTKF